MTLPSAEVLHSMAVELLKSLRHYHKGYRAAFRHADRERMALITQPTYCMASADDLLVDRVGIAAAQVKHCVSGVLPSESTASGLRAKAEAVAGWILHRREGAAGVGPTLSSPYEAGSTPA